MTVSKRMCVVDYFSSADARRVLLKGAMADIRRGREGLPESLKEQYVIEKKMREPKKFWENKHQNFGNINLEGDG